VGDFAWFVPLGAKKAVKGEIVEINTEVEIPYACMVEVIDSKYRTTKLSLLSDTSSGAKKLLSDKE
jgi:hypothetical protein